jgi:hypothetical protein
MIAKRFWGPVFEIFEILKIFEISGFFKFVTSYAADFIKVQKF